MKREALLLGIFLFVAADASAQAPKAAPPPALARNLATSNPSPDSPAVPRITAISPASLQASPEVQVVQIQGSNFGPRTRVEWRYTKGAGANQWRAPKHGFQVVNGSQIRVQISTGGEPDQMQIRVVDPAGTSNVAAFSVQGGGIIREPLGQGRNSDNCVLFARDRVPSLPYGLDTWQGKRNAINSSVPRVGSVAMIGFTSGPYRDIGHAAVVEDVTANAITIIEANYAAGQITRRTATGTDAADAARQLNIAGYYQPRNR